MLSLSSLAADVHVGVVEADKKRDREAVRFRLKRHEDVNANQADGATALHWAVHWDDLENAELLIRAGANLNASNELGLMPLSLISADRVEEGNSNRA